MSLCLCVRVSVCMLNTQHCIYVSAWCHCFRHPLVFTPTDTTNCCSVMPTARFLAGKQVLRVLQVLTSDPANEVWIISGRSQQELGEWFEAVVSW